jgi:hypothetical protein
MFSHLSHFCFPCFPRFRFSHHRLPVQIVWVLAVCQALVSCSTHVTDVRAKVGVFEHGINAVKTPWSSQPFDNHPDKFTFALFSDLTGGERPHIFSTAVAQLALLRPELIVNVGDLTEGGTLDKVIINTQWQSFHRRADKASTRIFYTGGNHDLANLTQRQVWQAEHGPRYYHFIYKNVLFLVLDTEDHPAETLAQIREMHTEAMALVAKQGWGVLGETAYAQLPSTQTGEIGAAQARYVTRVIADNPRVRWTFVLMHKPIWNREGENNFTAIETALASRPYTVFHGHNHFYKHTERLGRDYIQLGTTGGVQFADKNLSVDHVSLVTVDGDGIDIANIKLSGIFDKTGRVPHEGAAIDQMLAPLPQGRGQ